MHYDSLHAGNVVLLRGAAMWILAALILAWSMVGLGYQVPLIADIFAGKFHRLLQAHLDFLLMSALLLGFYATKVPLPWHVRWAMAIGAFTNSSLFLLMAIFPSLDPTAEGPHASGFVAGLNQLYMFASLVTTSYGFGRGAMLVLRSTFGRPPAR